MPRQMSLMGIFRQTDRGFLHGECSAARPWSLYKDVLTIVVITNNIHCMTGSTKVRRVGSPEETAFLDLLRTADMLSRGMVGVLKAEDLSATQYNVLRILRGSPAGLPCGEIASRMITRDPDVTRLLDRMEKRGLISRTREAHDRRLVTARITPEGLQLVDRMDEPVQEIHHKHLGHLGKDRLKALSELLAAARARVE